jgi:hypothetical protein
VNACASRHHKSRNPDRRIDHGHGQWSCGEGIARRASTDGVHRNREIGDSAVKSFGTFRFAKPRTPIRERAGVTSQRSHGVEPIAGANA